MKIRSAQGPAVPPTGAISSPLQGGSLQPHGAPVPFTSVRASTGPAGRRVPASALRRPGRAPQGVPLSQRYEPSVLAAASALADDRLRELIHEIRG